MGGGGSKEDKKEIFRQYAEGIQRFLEMAKAGIEVYKSKTDKERYLNLGLYPPNYEFFKKTLYIPGIHSGKQKEFFYNVAKKDYKTNKEKYDRYKKYVPLLRKQNGKLSQKQKEYFKSNGENPKQIENFFGWFWRKRRRRRRRTPSVRKPKITKDKCKNAYEKARYTKDLCKQKAGKRWTYRSWYKKKCDKDWGVKKRSVANDCEKWAHEAALKKVFAKKGSIKCPPCYQRAEKTYNQIVAFVQKKMIDPFLHKDEKTEHKWGEMSLNQAKDMKQKGKKLYGLVGKHIANMVANEKKKYDKGAAMRKKLKGVRETVKKFFNNLMNAKKRAIEMYKKYLEARKKRREEQDKALEREKKAEIKAEQNKYKKFLSGRYEWYKNLIFKLKDPDFNCGCYLDKYADLRKAFGNDCSKAAKHWEKYGRKEKRIGICEFDCKCYLNRYSDLKKKFGGDCTKAKKHWIAGKKRTKATCDITPKERVAISKARASYIVFLGWAVKRFNWAMAKIKNEKKLERMRFYFNAVHGPVYEKWKLWWAKAKQYLSDRQKAALQGLIDRHAAAQAKAVAYIKKRKAFWRKRALRIKMIKAWRIIEDWLPVIILILVILIGSLIYFGKQYGWFDSIILWFAPVTAWFNATFGPVFAWFSSILGPVFDWFSSIFSAIFAWFSSIFSAIFSWFSAIFAPVFAWFSAIFAPVFAWFNAIFGPVFAWFSAIFAPIFAWFRNLFGSDNNEVQTLENEIISGN